MGFGKRMARGCGAVVAGTLTAALMTAGPAAAAQVRHGSRPHVSLGPAARDVGHLHPRRVRTTRTSYRERPSEDRWPAAGTAVASPAAPVVTPPLTVPVSPLEAALSGRGPQADMGEAGKLPLFAGRASGRVSRVRFRLLSHAAAAAAGVDGVVFTATAASGKGGQVSLALDYASFAQAYGGGYGASLGLEELPACALTSPKVAACERGTRLKSVNDAQAQSVSADVTMPGNGSAIVLAATAAATDGGSTTGNYEQPAGNNPAGTWAAGGSDGDFTYSYPMAVPQTPGGLEPDVELDYDSGAVDAQTAGTQTQASWTGDGWSLPQDYISQSFTPCADDPEGSAAAESTQDACYDGLIFTLTLNGATTPLVCPSSFSYSAATETCYAEDDNGEIVTHYGDSGYGQGTHFTDYWTVTTTGGVTYSFGRNELPGWASGDTTTNSVDWEPVFSAHSGDPCYHLTASTFAGSVCDMAYQWNADYVTDAYGNAMAYFYTQASNGYDEYGQTTAQKYIRDSYLKDILYGFTGGNAYSTAAATAPADEVSFTAEERCFAGSADCGTAPSSSNTAYWLDVPYELSCTVGDSCSGASGYGPSFWSTVALASVKTLQRTGSATAPSTPVDTWTLSQGFPSLPSGDASDVPSLELQSITRQGQDATVTATTGGTVSVPAISFGYTMLQNQLDPGTAPWMSRPRLTTVTTETGSVISVAYEQPDACSASTDPVSPSANDLSCFPIYWGSFTPSTSPDWFIKYAVAYVSQSDPSGGSPGLYTSYEYESPAWHYDDNQAVEAKDRTYGQWRGYQAVYTFTGTGSDPQTESGTTYYQGMSDDDDSTDVTITDSQGSAHEDADQLAGDVLEQTTYNYATAPPGTPPQSAVSNSTVYSYWISGNVASLSRTGLPALTANATGVAEQWTRQAITDTSTTTWQETATDTTYNSTVTSAELGTPEYVYQLGDLSQLSDPAEETCTSYTYITGSDNLVLTASTQVVALPCGGSDTGTASMPSSSEVNALAAPSGVASADVVSDSRTFYDDATLAGTWPQPASSSITWPQAAPANPEVSVVQDASSYDSSSGDFTYQTSSADLYNSYGQVTSSYDGNGGEHTVSGTATYSPTTTAYTATDGSDTAETVTNPLGQATTTTYDPARSLPVTVTDPNGLVTTYQYDELGRLTSEWDDNRPASSSATDTYAYTIGTSTTPTVVTTKQLDAAGGYETSTTLYDALLRVRQTQVPAPQGGVLVTDDFYDSRGWEWKVNTNWWDSTADPSGTILTVPDSQVPDQTVTSYDALGRPVQVTTYDDSSVYSTAYTDYTGDSTITVPATTLNSSGVPSSGSPTATVTDATGRTIEQDSYTSEPAVATGTNTGGFPTVSVTGGSTQATTYAWNSQDQVSGITTGGETWNYAWNMLGQQISETTPDTIGATTMQYDADGNLIQSTDADGNTITDTYDALGRQTGEYDGTSASAPPIATWTYDNSNNVSGVTDAIGQLTTETSYDQNGDAWTIQQSGFNDFGESTGETVTVPSDQGALAGSYAFSEAYTANVGLPEEAYYPASPDGGSLPAENVITGYSAGFDLPDALASNLAGYADSVTYTAWSQPSQEELGTSAANAYITSTYDPTTGNLTDTTVDNTQESPAPYDDTSYTYDPSGNITSETDTRNGTQTELQCYGYNTLDELTQAWTTDGTSACSAGPSTGTGGTVGDGISGSAYWDQWSYNALGNQVSETSQSVTGGTATTTDYTYSSSTQPDTLTSSSGGTTASYSYDNDGNTTAIDQSTGSQALTWYPDGNLSTDTTSAGTTSYVYDADGNLLATDDPGSDTIYIFGEQITATTGSDPTVTGIRYLGLPGGGQVVRTGSGTSYYYETGDQHGTMMLALDHTLQNPVWRQFTPYGAPRGTATGTWPDTNGYLGDPVDSNDTLTTIGARQYDPATGRFLSLDPVLEAGDPAQMGGYAYAADNPVSQSDPSGQMPAYYDLESGTCTGDAAACGRTMAAQQNDIENQELTGERDAGWDLPSLRAQAESWTKPKQAAANLAAHAAQQQAEQEQAAAQQQQQQTAYQTSQQANSSGGCGLSCAWQGVQDAAQAAGSRLTDAYHFAMNNRGTLLTLAAIATCLSGFGTLACGAMLAAAYAVRAQQRIGAYGFKRSLDANLADGVLTVAFAIPMAGAAITGGQVLTGGSQLILNGAASIPDAVQITAGFLPGHDPVFFNGSTLNF